MPYREDLDAAYARIEALEAELADARAEIARLSGIIERIRSGEEVEERKRLEREREKEDQRRLREKMEREQREVEAALAHRTRTRDD